MNLLTLKVNNLVITEFGYEIGDNISELSNFVSQNMMLNCDHFVTNFVGSTTNP